MVLRDLAVADAFAIPTLSRTVNIGQIMRKELRNDRGRADEDLSLNARHLLARQAQLSSRALPACSRPPQGAIEAAVLHDGKDTAGCSHGREVEVDLSTRIETTHVSVRKGLILDLGPKECQLSKMYALNVMRRRTPVFRIAVNFASNAEAGRVTTITLARLG
jgi:hypothetical protein